MKIKLVASKAPEFVVITETTWMHNFPKDKVFILDHRLYAYKKASFVERHWGSVQIRTKDGYLAVDAHEMKKVLEERWEEYMEADCLNVSRVLTDMCYRG